MSEKIYALLLRLFPSQFRESYGDEALQLFRDRTRDERGIFPRLRLWFDLLADIALSVPREYFHAQTELVGAPARRHLAGTLSFQVLADESPHPGALLLGGVLSLSALATFSFLLSHGGNHRRRSASAIQRQRPFSVSSRPAPEAAYDRNFPLAGDDETLAPTSQEPAAATTPFSPDNAKPTTATAFENVSLDPAERHRVITAARANLKQYYVYPEIAQKMSDTLLAHEKSGDDNTVAGGEAFADLLTKQMRNVSHDMHLTLVYSRDPLPEHPQGPTPEGLARYRKTLEEENCTFEKLEILPHNIGYLKLNSFPDPSICESTARAAMRRLNDVDAIIFDLRDNHGGEPSMVMLMAAYLFDHPEYMYSPRDNTTEHSWTRSPVPGSKLADKPAYILTSRTTFSGAEHFSYDLKMLKRATLVGETTGGATHSGVWHRIDEHFGMGIPETKPINPFSTTDWAETGVAPDVKVKAADALATAVELAESKLRSK